MAQNSPLERWRSALLKSTSLPQVLLHLSVLDSCVVWSKSFLNAQCRICRKKSDADKMLLCDGCDRGHHMYCLKPPLKVGLPLTTSFCEAGMALSCASAHNLWGEGKVSFSSLSFVRKFRKATGTAASANQRAS